MKDKFIEHTATIEIGDAWTTQKGTLDDLHEAVLAIYANSGAPTSAEIEASRSHVTARWRVKIGDHKN